MKKIILKSLLLVTISLGITSCVNDDSYSTPTDTLETFELTTTTTVAAVNSAATGTPVEYTADDIIEAYVTSSDESGTFYKSISFQTIPTDGSAPIGFSVPIDVTTLYGKGFTPGRKVYIKLKGLYTAKVFGSLQIGSLFEGNSVGRLSVFEWKNHLFPSATVVDEDTFVRTLTLAQAYTDANQNTLVELDAVQFTDGSINNGTNNRTYYDDDSGGGATNHLLTALTGGTQRIIRFSSFAIFTGNEVAQGSGKIRGVLSKFNSDFQFVVRYESDIKLNNPRVDVNPPIVGNAIQFLGAFTENFESYTSGTGSAGQNNFPKYINDPVKGSKTWRTRLSSGTKYIEMSSFGSPSEDNRTLFVVPVDMTAANNFSFQTRTNFYNGQTLKVYYSTNYVPGNNISTATLVNITSNFSISTANTSTAAFTNSNVYQIPATVTGNGYFIFEYIGSALSTPAVTTNMQIDNIVVN